MDEVIWQGWSNGREPYKREAIHVGPLPGRKSICLYTMDYREGAAMYVHAYFRNEDEAKRFIETVNRFFGFESNTNEENQ